MNRRIYKYELDLDAFRAYGDGARLEFQIHGGAVPLTVQAQNGTPCLWAIVDPDKPMRPARVLMFGTGATVTDQVGAADWLGTVQFRRGAIVFHFFWDGP